MPTFLIQTNAIVTVRRKKRGGAWEAATTCDLTQRSTKAAEYPLELQNYLFCVGLVSLHFLFSLFVWGGLLFSSFFLLFKSAAYSLCVCVCARAWACVRVRVCVYVYF